VGWSGERFNPRFSDIDIAIPPMYRDEQTTDEAAENDAKPIAIDEGVSDELLAMLDDPAPSADAQFADGDENSDTSGSDEIA